MAIELESNRLKEAYERLMAAALATLAPRPDDVAEHYNYRHLPPCGPIHLQTLTITISPVWKRVDGHRFLSVISFFSPGRWGVLQQLQRIHVDYLRINVHVNSHRKPAKTPALQAFQESRRLPHKRQYHLETTLDMRYLPRPNNHSSSSNNMRSESDNEITFLWKNDALIHEARQRQAEKTAETLRHLRKHIEAACVRPDKALEQGQLWEQHAAAEEWRKKERAELEARLNGDNLRAKNVDEEGEEEEEDWRVGGERKFLIMSFVEIGGQVRAYRA
jgi:hypothetical protein